MTPGRPFANLGAQTSRSELKMDEKPSFLTVLINSVSETGAFTSMAIGLLAICLKENGALHGGQFETKIDAMLQAPGAANHPMQRDLLTLLLKSLQGDVPEVQAH
jgi:hypothetical protein